MLWALFLPHCGVACPRSDSYPISLPFLFGPDWGGHSPGARALGLGARFTREASGWTSSGSPAGKMWSSEWQFCNSRLLATWAVDSLDIARPHHPASPPGGISLHTHCPWFRCSKSLSPRCFSSHHLGVGVRNGQGARDYPPQKRGTHNPSTHVLEMLGGGYE